MEIAHCAIVCGSLILRRGGHQVFGRKESWEGLAAKVVLVEALSGEFFKSQVSQMRRRVEVAGFKLEGSVLRI